MRSKLVHPAQSRVRVRHSVNGGGETAAKSCLKLGLLALALCGHVAVATSPACDESEREVFACSTGPKRIAVCLQQAEDRTHQGLIYRFGTPLGTELTLSGNEPIKSGWETDASGGTAFLKFRNGEYQYVVYSRQGGGTGACPDAPEMWCPWLDEGVLVFRGGELLSRIACLENDGPSELWRVKGELGAASERVELERGETLDILRRMDRGNHER